LQSLFGCGKDRQAQSAQTVSDHSKLKPKFKKNSKTNFTGVLLECNRIFMYLTGEKNTHKIIFKDDLFM
jgi:hypothetical protein